MCDALRSVYMMPGDTPNYNDPSLYRSVPFRFYDAETEKSYFYANPRSIHFFEVEFCQSRVTDDEQPLTTGDGNIDAADESDWFECVAVGLSTNSFLKQKRLPGWDEESYGFHGDDGAIFHGRGWQLSSFGPTFGFNDVVGCGLDFCNRSIFFTLNGKYLGTAFTNVRTDKALFPTVGLDANVEVKFNFGLTPFLFDLKGHIEQQQTAAGRSNPQPKQPSLTPYMSTKFKAAATFAATAAFAATVARTRA